MSRLNGYLREHRRAALAARRCGLAAMNTQDNAKSERFYKRAGDWAVYANDLRLALLCEIECQLLDRRKQ